jgi:kynurenine formamidase
MHVHHIVLPYMGMPIIDNADLEDVARTCSEVGRWEFQFVCAPLVITRGTGSPVNPLAVF